VSNMTDVSVLHSSVFPSHSDEGQQHASHKPTPVGPRKRNEAMGRFWFANPALERRI
jgi:hypothetical protein